MEFFFFVTWPEVFFVMRPEGPLSFTFLLNSAGRSFVLSSVSWVPKRPRLEGSSGVFFFVTRPEVFFRYEARGFFSLSVDTRSAREQRA